MVDKRISELDPLGEALADADLMAVVHDGVTNKATLAQLLTLIRDSLIHSFNGTGASFSVVDGMNTPTLNDFVMYGLQGDYGQFVGRLTATAEATVGPRKTITITIPGSGYYGPARGVGTLVDIATSQCYPCFVHGESGSGNMMVFSIYVDAACVVASGLISIYFIGSNYFGAS